MPFLLVGGLLSLLGDAGASRARTALARAAARPGDRRLDNSRHPVRDPRAGARHILRRPARRLHDRGLPSVRACRHRWSGEPVGAWAAARRLEPRGPAGYAWPGEGLAGPHHRRRGCWTSCRPGPWSGCPATRRGRRTPSPGCSSSGASGSSRPPGVRRAGCARGAGRAGVRHPGRHAVRRGRRRRVPPLRGRGRVRRPGRRDRRRGVWLQLGVVDEDAFERTTGGGGADGDGHLPGHRVGAGAAASRPASQVDPRLGHGDAERASASSSTHSTSRVSHSGITGLSVSPAARQRCTSSAWWV